MDNVLYNKIKTLKNNYVIEGFLILGIFGSYARNEETERSDVDILYEINDKFLNKYVGWDAILRLDEIKTEIENSLNIKVDIADKNALNRVAKKYIIPEVLSV
jgi:uncharacterized protein